MRFVFPCEEYEQKAVDFVQEFRDCGSEIHGTGGLDGYLAEYTYSEWLKKTLCDIDIANIPEGRVPALTYFYVREEDDKIVGMINIRLALNDFLRTEGGHIGYCVRPAERRRGYATEMLRDTIKHCRVIGMSGFLITCDKENHASAGVIKSCGGVLEAEFYSEVFKETIQRYLIK